MDLSIRMELSGKICENMKIINNEGQQGEGASRVFCVTSLPNALQWICFVAPEETSSSSTQEGRLVVKGCTLHLTLRAWNPAGQSSRIFWSLSFPVLLRLTKPRREGSESLKVLWIFWNHSRFSGYFASDTGRFLVPALLGLISFDWDYLVEDNWIKFLWWNLEFSSLGKDKL